MKLAVRGPVTIGTSGPHVVAQRRSCVSQNTRRKVSCAFKVSDEKGNEGANRRLEETTEPKQKEQIIGELEQKFNEANAPEVPATTTSVGTDPSAPKWPVFVPVFSRRREVLNGRLAILGFSGTCIGEYFTHMGPIGQLSMETGIPYPTMFFITTTLAAYYFLGGLVPGGPTFTNANLVDVSKRPAGPPNSMVSPFDIPSLLGCSGWGFTKRNELFQGRLTMFGMAALVRSEMMNGLGPMGQVATWFHATPDDYYYQKAGVALLVWSVFAGLFGWFRDGSRQKKNLELEIY